MTNDSDATRAVPDICVPPNPGAIDSGGDAEIKGSLDVVPANAGTHTPSVGSDGEGVGD